MIRPFTTVCMILAAGSMLYVYQTKHRGQLLDKEIARTLKATDAVRERMLHLQSDWSQMNEPTRLSELARQYFSLATTPQQQLVLLQDLGGRLPTPLPVGTSMVPASEPAAASPAAVVASAAVAATPPITAARAPAASHAGPAVAQVVAPAAAARPVQVASLPTPPVAVSSAVPTLPAPSRPAARAAAHAAADHSLPEPPPERPVADRTMADRTAAERAQQGSLPRPQSMAELPPPPPPAPSRPRIMAPVVTAVAPPIPAPQPVRRVAAATPAAVAHAVSAPAVIPAMVQVAIQGYGSVLGGARAASLPAPVPYTQASR